MRIQEAKRIVFFGGAGTSTESGIPDFRSAGRSEDNENAVSSRDGASAPAGERAGLFREESGFAYPAETILSRSFFDQNPETFYSFYRSKLLYPNAKPNGAHRALARLEEEGKLSGIITQNIDGLHQQAGSRKVIELHGTVLANTCLACGAKHPLKTVLDSPEVIPRCPQCGGLLKPDVVLYEESLDLDALERSVEWLQQADLLLIGGTSLTVTPAALLVRYYRGLHLVLLNKSSTPYDHKASLVIRDSIGQVLEAAVDSLYGG
ncbi:NAD-dependent protein deacylase [Gorillibacterium sp. CAU 1737]|uniref:NAD-dependent protein deacylase n=1 Tax=Gorillibacterium sp. CAU 1737 TaxID=3140362 RepID=UPI00326171C8